MEIALDSGAKKAVLLGAALLAGIIFVAISTLQFASNWLSTSPEYLQLAVRLAPGNAEYHELLGHKLLEARTDIPAALGQYRLAATLNPHDANYWLSLAKVEQLLDDVPGQHFALQRTIEADPTTPDLAWAAGNFFLAQGDTAKALEQFKVVIENEPGTAYAAFALAAHVVDVGTIIDKMMPSDPAAYLSLIDFLTSQKKTAEAIQAWNALVQLRKPFELRLALAYVDYLISQREVKNATLAWRQMAQLCGWSARLASSDNLIFNPHFDSDIINGGFDWHYQRQPNVEVTLDPAELHSGHRSLSVVFDGPGVDDAGISQAVPVQPNTTYEFSAYYKANAMDGAGGPRLDIEDAYSGTHYFSTDDLRDADVWHEISGEFQTASNAQLIILTLVRIPLGSPIRGKLWVGDLRLAEREAGL